MQGGSMENDNTKEKVFQETLEMEVGRRLKEFRKALPGKFTQKKMCEELVNSAQYKYISYTALYTVRSFALFFRSIV